jgi:hypothetical protein
MRGLVLVAILCATAALGACRGGDTSPTKNPDEFELAKSSTSQRGAPGNPRGPTDPSR